MSEHYLFTVRCWPVKNDEGHTIYQDLTFTRLCLDSGEELVLSGKGMQVESCPLSDCYVHSMVADSGTLYVCGEVLDWDDEYRMGSALPVTIANYTHRSMDELEQLKCILVLDE